MLGWRARLGLILTHPVVDMVPHEFYRLAPRGTLLLAIGLGLPDLKTFWNRSYEEVRDSYLAATRQLIEQEADVIHLGGGDSLLSYGVDGLRRLLSDLQAASPVLVKSTPSVLGPALRAVGASRVVIAGGYSPRSLEATTAFLAESGVRVLGTHGAALDAAAGASPFPAYRAAKAALRAQPTADAVLLVGGNWTPIHIIEEIEADLGVPVVTSVQAMVWSSLRWVGVNEPLAGGGSLLRAGSFTPAEIRSFGGAPAPLPAAVP